MIFVALAAGALAGLSSMPHCLGMCGPLAAFACRSSLPDQAGPRLARYLGGRFVSYTTLGALAGAGGAALSAAFAPAWSGALLSAGLSISLAVSAYRLWRGPRAAPLTTLRRTATPSRLANLRTRLTSLRTRLASLAPHEPLAIGLASALLPCGALLAGVVVAAGAGTPLGGAAAMFGFATTSALGLSVAGLVGARAQLTSLRARRGLAVGLALGAAVLAVRPFLGIATDDPTCHPGDAASLAEPTPTGRADT